VTVPATPHFVTVAGGQLRLWSAGEGAPVVVLPGLVRAASVVANRLAAVAPDRAFRVIELPGIGGSADVPCESLAQIVDAVRGAIERCGLGGAPILAFDLAAPIAAQLRGTREFVNLAPARAWARRPLAAPDLTEPISMPCSRICATRRCSMRRPAGARRAKATRFRPRTNSTP